MVGGSSCGSNQVHYPNPNFLQADGNAKDDLDTLVDGNAKDNADREGECRRSKVVPAS